MDLPDPVAALAAGHFHTLALTRGGDVWAWGRNGNGQLGIGTTAGRGDHCTPQRLEDLAGAAVCRLQSFYHLLFSCKYCAFMCILAFCAVRQHFCFRAFSCTSVHLCAVLHHAAAKHFGAHFNAAPQRQVPAWSA